MRTKGTVAERISCFDFLPITGDMVVNKGLSGLELIGYAAAYGRSNHGHPIRTSEVALLGGVGYEEARAAMLKLFSDGLVERYTREPDESWRTVGESWSTVGSEDEF